MLLEYFCSWNPLYNFSFLAQFILLSNLISMKHSVSSVIQKLRTEVFRSNYFLLPGYSDEYWRKCWMWPHKWACYNIFLKKFKAKICKIFMVILLVSNIRTLYPLFFSMNYLLCWRVKAYSNDWNKVLTCGYNRWRKFNCVNLMVHRKSVLQLALWASLS